MEGGIHDNISANILLLNALYKYAKNRSFRFELQNLFTKQDNGNWPTAIAEFGFAPALNIYVINLYNCRVTNVHYMGIGGSYAKGATRFAIGSGRQRAGLNCVGGVCRFVPAATGITGTLTITFNN